MIVTAGVLLQSTATDDGPSAAAPLNAGDAGALVESSVPETAISGAGIPATVIFEIAILVVVATAAIAACWRWKFFKLPTEASGRIPLDPPMGALAMLGIYVLGIIGASVVAGSLPESTRTDADWSRLLVGVLANALQCIGAIGFLQSRLAVDGSRRRATFIHAIAEGTIGFVLVVPIVFAAAAFLGAALPLLGLPRAPEVSHQTLEILRAKANIVFTWTTLIHVVVLVPLAEELLWRGLMQPSMRAVGLPPLAAICTTSALFAAIHWTSIPADGRATGLVMLVILSIALGILRDRTGGILAPAIAHGLFNALNVAMALRA